MSAPLSGTPADATGHCETIPANPQNTARCFHHSEGVSSYNALCALIQEFSDGDVHGLLPNGYGAVLRTDAFKTFLVITDDRPAFDSSGCTPNSFDDMNTANGGMAVAADWDSALRALSPSYFGSQNARNYVFHSIIGVKPYDPGNLALPYPPDAPIVCGDNPGDKCPDSSECTPSAQSPGTGYQALSVLTGGLRYPSCGLDYTTIFQKIAEGVIEISKVACEFEIPKAPGGQQLELETMVVEYTPGGSEMVTSLIKVEDAAACVPEGFYIAGGKIRLCPDVCEDVKADDGAQVKLKFGCTAAPT